MTLTYTDLTVEVPLSISVEGITVRGMTYRHTHCGNELVNVELTGTAVITHAPRSNDS